MTLLKKLESIASEFFKYPEEMFLQYYTHNVYVVGSIL